MSGETLGKKLENAKKFKNLNNYPKEMVTFFKDENFEMKKTLKKDKTIPIVLKPVDISVKVAKTSASVTITVKEFGLIVKQKSTGSPLGLSFSNTV